MIERLAQQSFQKKKKKWNPDNTEGNMFKFIKKALREIKIQHLFT
jgi:hypothetical protein